VKYNCCICDEEMSESSLDTCSMGIRTNIDNDWKEQKEQTFFCHSNCLKNVMKDSRSMYILEDDFPTLGEIEDEKE